MTDATQANLDTTDSGEPTQPVEGLVRYVRVQRTVTVYAIHPVSHYGDMDERAIRDFEIEASKDGYDHFEQVTEMVQAVPDRNIDNSVTVHFVQMTAEQAAKHQV